MNNNTYKFVGVINIFGVKPDFVYPVFVKNGKYYFQKLNEGTITSFREIKENLYISMIHFFDTNLLENVKLEYIIGDDQLVAFQINQNDFFVNELNIFTSFIEKFNTDDDILREEIDCFLDMVKRKNILVKKRIKTK